MSRSRQLAAIMFTDIVGYTALMQQNEKKAIQARDKHRHIFNSSTDKYKGRVLQYYGDGTLSIFNSAIDAVKCGIEMQLNFRKKPSIPVRIGIHTGDIIFSEEEIIGDSVNVASRIESLAVPGSVFISDKVHDEIKNQESVKTSLLKTFKLKNVERPIKVYAISNAGLIVPKPDEIEGKPRIDISATPEKQEIHKSVTTKGGSGATILTTKLYIPPLRPKFVRRLHLIELLDKGQNGKLTLISAPAGFGKTTLISEWIAANERPTAWLSLDEGDNDPIRFFTYFVAAIQTIAANVGEGALAVLQSPQPPPTESILTALLNEITTVPDNFVLVLDDYHVIDTKSIDNALTFLLEHLPPQMHLVITTRKDPDLPLPRLRVRGQLTELRATNLRFTPSEAAGFFNQVMDLNLPAEDINTLENRTEGWIAGLKLAALSMQGREDITGFIQAFAGHDRYIVDYLVEEVLRSQPERVRSFLLQTSILDRLSGPLCAAVTSQEDSKKMLEALERGNLFVVTLDDKRQWFRYHHLFADVLLAHSMEEQPDLIPTLHLRASKWYENNDLPADAIHHALAAEDFERVAALAELAWPAMDGSFQTATWLGWVKAIPDDLVHVRPVLSLGYAWAVLSDGDLEAGEARLQEAERWLVPSENVSEPSETPSATMVVVDNEQFRFLPASIATARAYIAQTRGDVPSTVKQARRALELLPEEDHIRCGVVAALLGLAYWANGDLETAYQTLTNAMASMQKGGNILFSISGAYGLADIRVSQGHLREAAHIYKQALQLAAKQGESLQMVTANLYLGLSELSREWGDLEASAQHLLRSKELGEKAALPDWPYRWCLAQARIKEIQGDLDGTLDLLHQAELLYYRNPVPDVRPVAAMRSRVWIRQGRLAEALNWVRNHGLSVHDDLSFLREFEHVTLARVLMAEYKNEREDRSILEIMELLERLLKAAEEGKRIGSVIEILVLQALAHEMQGNIQPALLSLGRALVLAEPEGYIRIFVDEGPLIAELIEKILDTKTAAPRPYLKKLVSAFKLNKRSMEDDGLVEPLSERELEVLRHIAAGQSNKKVMEELFLSLSTVKTHIRNIYSKLNVHSRTEAVIKARELNLL
jgi:LuxR family maltose regulon positive regulatory protein